MKFRPNTVMINRMLLWTPLLFFGIGGAWFLALFLDNLDAGPVYDNLVPELIGFCLEGFFLIGLFSLIQRRRERDLRHQLDDLALCQLIQCRLNHAHGTLNNLASCGHDG